MLAKPKPLIIPKRGLLLPPSSRRPLPRPAPWIWIPKRFAPTMAVAFDAKAGAATQPNGVSSPMNSSTLVAAAGATLVLGIFTCTDTSGAALSTPTAMTYAGSSMTAVSNKASSDNHNNIYIYAIVNPTTGSHTGSVTFTGGTASVNQQIDFDVMSFTGTNTTSVASCIPSANIITDASNDNGTHYPASAFTVTTVSGDAAFAAVNAAGTAYQTLAIGTLIDFEDSGVLNYCSGYHLATSSSTQIQFNVSAGGSSPTCGIAFDIAQPGGGDVLAASPGIRWI